MFMRKRVYLSLLILMLMFGRLSAQTNIIINHLPITKFGYPGRKIRFKATIITQNCSVSSITLFYRQEGASEFKGIPMVTNNGPTNYVAYITNSAETLIDIEYFINVRNNYFSNFWAPEHSGSINYYALSISPKIEENIQFDKEGKVILPDDIPDDLKYTGVTIPAYSIYKNSTFGIENMNNYIDLSMESENMSSVHIYRFYKKYNSTIEESSFNKDVELSLRYFDENSDGIVDETSYSEDSLGLYWWDGIEWREVSFIQDKDNNLFKADISHTGIYGIFYIVNNISYSAGRIVEYVSNPSFFPVEGEIVTFGIKKEYSDYKIRIFNFDGNLVKELTTNSWDGTDEQGNLVDSGIYIYTIEAANSSVSGMVSVNK